MEVVAITSESMYQTIIESHIFPSILAKLVTTMWP